MLSFIGAYFPYLVISGMALFAGVMLFVTIEEGILARRARLVRTVGATGMGSAMAGMDDETAQADPTNDENSYRAVA